MKLKRFFANVFGEISKCVYISKDKLFKYTGIVFVVNILMFLLIFLFDNVFQSLIEVIQK